MGVPTSFATVIFRSQRMVIRYGALTPSFMKPSPRVQRARYLDRRCPDRKRRLSP